MSKDPRVEECGFEDGFLSDSVASVRAIVRSRYKDWSELLRNINREVTRVQHAVAVPAADERLVLAAVLFSRILASTQAAILLLEHGLISQSRAVLRSAVEALFSLGAVVRHPEMARKLLATHEADQRTVAMRALRWQSDPMRQAIASRLSEFKRLAGLKVNKLPTEQIAIAAEMGDIYNGIYVLLCLSAHGAVFDLELRHVLKDAEGICALKNEPEIEGQVPTWEYAVIVLLHATEAMQELFGPLGVSLDKHIAAWRALTTSDSGSAIDAPPER